MSYPLKQSTASQEVPLGIFLDDSDGKTPETGLTIANTDIKLHKTGASALANKNSGGATHMAGGIYYATLDATDTNTVGPLVMFVQVAGALPVRLECDVLPANVYDARYGTDLLQVDVREVGGTAQTAGDIMADTNDIQSRLPAALVGGRLDVSVGAMQANVLTAAATAADYVTEVAGAATTALGSDITAIKAKTDNLPSDPADQSLIIAATDSIRSDIAAVQSDTDNLQTRLPAALVSGRMDVSVGAMAANTLTASALAADAVTEIQSGLSTDVIDGVLGATVEGSVTVVQSLRLSNSVLAGKASGLETTSAVYRDVGDTKDRITATVDSDGNRSAVIRDLS